MINSLRKRLHFFIYLLKTREITHKRSKERAWFEANILKTDQLRKVQERTKPPIEKDIEEAIRGILEKYDLEYVEMTLSDLYEEIKNISRFPKHKADIRHYLTDNLNVHPTKSSQRYRLPFGEKQDGELDYNSKTGHFYRFSVNIFKKNNE